MGCAFLDSLLLGPGPEGAGSAENGPNEGSEPSGGSYSLVKGPRHEELIGTQLFSKRLTVSTRIIEPLGSLFFSRVAVRVGAPFGMLEESGTKCRTTTRVPSAAVWDSTKGKLDKWKNSWDPGAPKSDHLNFFAGICGDPLTALRRETLAKRAVAPGAQGSSKFELPVACPSCPVDSARFVCVFFWGRVTIPLKSTNQEKDALFFPPWKSTGHLSYEFVLCSLVG